MNPVYLWFQNNMDLVFHVYGLAFVIMGLSIVFQPKKESQFEIANVLWLLVAYALIHGPSEFINVWLLTRGGSEFYLFAGKLFTYIAYLFLFEFGRRLITLTGKNIAWWILPISCAAIFIISLISANFWVTIDILLGYFVRLPAGIMSAAGFFLYYKVNRKTLDSYNVKKYFMYTGTALFMWAFFCGVLRMKGDFFPASVLNIDSFFLFTGIPVYVFRSICALVASGGIIGILKIFNLEGRRRIQEAIDKERAATMRQEQIMALNETRDRVAQNLHHEIGTMLTSITYLAQSLDDQNMPRRKRETGNVLSMILDSSMDAQEKISDLIWIIDPHNDNWDELFAKLRRYASDLFDSKQIRYEINFPSTIDSDTLEMERRQHFWLIYKEIVNNIANHSKCKNASIEITNLEGTIGLNVEDDGVGFDPEVLKGAGGINGIRMRAAHLNARCDLKTHPQEGTKWEIDFKL